jgi:hypothetical protein
MMMFKVLFTLNVCNAEYTMDFIKGRRISEDQDDEYGELVTVPVILGEGDFNDINDIVSRAAELARDYQVDVDRITIRQLL